MGEQNNQQQSNKLCTANLFAIRDETKRELFQSILFTIMAIDEDGVTFRQGWRSFGKSTGVHDDPHSSPHVGGSDESLRQVS